MRIAVAGGVTGGHIYPAVAVLEYFMQQKENVQVLYFATPHGLENREIVRLFPHARIVKLDVGGLIRPLYSPGNLKVAMRLWRAMRVCKRELEGFSPDFSFITGGYVSVPVGLMSQRLTVPTFVHEQNAIAGKANRVVGKRCTRIFTSFPESSRDFGEHLAHKILHTGNPVRNVENRDRKIFEALGLNPNKKIILVTGGSGGSDFINDRMMELYRHFSGENHEMEFLHSCGNEQTLHRLREFEFVHPFSFIEDMHLYLSAADAVVARGGATTVAEIIAYGVPALIIPWSGAAENHQLINAISLEKNRAGFFLEEKEASVEAIGRKLQMLLDKKISQSMRFQLKELRPLQNPAHRIFEEITLSIAHAQSQA